MVTTAHPGLQQTRNTGVRVRLYCQGDDPVVQTAQGVVEFIGKRNNPDSEPCVTAVSTSKSLGAASGQFTLTIKAPSAWGGGKDSFLDRVVDDDWIDIVFTVNNKPHHVLRGMVDTVREAVSTSGDGATSRTYTITGRDHGCVFEKTPIWFNIHKEALARTYAMKILESKGVAGSPDETVRKLLYGFMETLTGLGRANWALPKSMPSVANTFPEQFLFYPDDFFPQPSRIAASVQLLDPEHKSIWALAQEWSDPMFCELFCDLVPSSGQFSPDATLDVTDTNMAVVFRNRPHPVTDMGSQSLWFKLPMTVVPPQWVTSRDIGRGGLERYNAFFVSPQVVQAMNRVDLNAPLWDVKSISRHGLRPFYVESRYIAEDNDLATMSSRQRDTARDWHCMNPLLLNGSMSLAVLMPNIRIGSRFRIAGERNVQQETYYVEQVSHQWSASSGGTTRLGVTRGWVGGEDAYLSTLQKLSGRYTSAAR